MKTRSDIRCRGFTLIELLAVIVVLAIIALIATPTVINVVDQAKQDAFSNTAYGLVSAGNVYYSKKISGVGGMFGTATFTIQDNEWSSNEKLEINGELPDSGTIKINSNGKVSLSLIKDDWCAVKGFADTKVTISTDLVNCRLKEYSETILNGAEPELGTGMIPVTIESSGTVKKADINQKWYDYGNKEWANVVMVTSTSRANYEKATPGTIIQEQDILTYLVWIPRFKYQIWNPDGVNGGTQPRSIRIQFENASQNVSFGTASGNWLTHPAFCYGTYNEGNGMCSGTQVNGFWAGKFETGYRQSESMTNSDIASWTTAGAQVSSPSTENLIIKPNVYSLRNLNLNMMFETVSNMTESGNVFGFSSSSNAHVMKNSEWGAIVYLSHSVYGKGGQVRLNNNSSFMTGCAGGSENAALASACNPYHGTVGVLASTTGNVTGIYDMSGGAAEYVMGYTTNASTKYGSSGFTDATFPSKRFINLYTATSNTQYENGKFGDATRELGPFSNFVSSWYSGYGAFVSSSSPWILRGGKYDETTKANMFTFSSDSGSGNVNYSFRVAVIGQDFS